MVRNFENVETITIITYSLLKMEIIWCDIYDPRILILHHNNKVFCKIQVYDAMTSPQPIIRLIFFNIARTLTCPTLTIFHTLPYKNSGQRHFHAILN
jgi:hypothetical protein